MTTPTTFDLPFSGDKLPGEPEHDPNGEVIQTHDMPDGGMIITFDPVWAEGMGWRVGDTMRWEVLEGGGLQMTHVPTP
jgi:hypothetical protein